MNATTTIRVSTETRNVLRELAQSIGVPMQKVIEQAIDEYQRQHFLYAANTAYAQLREDAPEWNAYQDEQREWDVALNDGLERVS